MSTDRVIVRLSTNKKRGTFTAEVVGHEGASRCSDAVDEALINDILNMEIDGFGAMTTKEDSGKTSEFYNEVKPHVAKPIKMDDPPFPEDDGSSGGGKKTKMGLGYGV